ncbi:MAG TPA: hypothetical protein VIY90_21235 [Steroidobacteraceae bacterium]
MPERSTCFVGGCHCGALTFRYDTAVLVTAWSVRACQCSFCRAHAAVSTSDPAGSLAFQVTQSGLLQRYRFGSGVTDFLLCRACGVYVGATSSDATGRFGLINVRALKSIPDDLPSPTSMHYENEAPGDRLSRRAERWTPLRAESL